MNDLRAKDLINKIINKTVEECHELCKGLGKLKTIK